MTNAGGFLLSCPPLKATPVPERCHPIARVWDYVDFRASDYFDTYYEHTVLPDEQRVLAYQLGLLECQPVKFSCALEYGCGPTVHRAIAASNYVFRIDMADRVAGNLAQIAAWLKGGPDNTVWNHFTDYVLGCESKRRIDAHQVMRREEHTRKVIRDLYVSDARWANPLGAARRGFYDLIVSGFCIDAVSQDKRVWRECMRNVLSMLSDGGLLILHALRRCTAYSVGERLYPNADLTKDDLYRALLANDLVKGTLDVEVIPCPENARYGYSSVLVASGRKAWRRRRAVWRARPDQQRCDPWPSKGLSAYADGF